MSDGVAYGELALGLSVIVVDVDDHPTGDGVRIFFGNRSDGRYIWIGAQHERECAEARRAWASRTGHLLVKTPPPNCVYLEADQDQVPDGAL